MSPDLAADPDLSGTTVLLTGAARGIGREVAAELARHGARLMLTATDGAALALVARRCGDRAAFVEADLAQADAGRAVVEAALRRFGRIDVVINNAGIGMASHWPDFWTRPVRFWDVPRTSFETYLRVNLLAGLDITQRLVPAMIERGWGRVINVTTSLSTMLLAGQGPYGVSKAGAEALTAIQAEDLAGTGVTANAVTTGGSADTRLIPDPVPRDSLLPANILARPVLWLASRLSDGVTGRRFVGAAWNSELPLHAAAAASSAPVAWTGYGGPPSHPVPSARPDDEA